MVEVEAVEEAEEAAGETQNLLLWQKAAIIGTRIKRKQRLEKSLNKCEGIRVISCINYFGNSVFIL